MPISSRARHITKRSAQYICVSHNACESSTPPYKSKKVRARARLAANPTDSRFNSRIKAGVVDTPVRTHTQAKLATGILELHLEGIQTCGRRPVSMRRIR